MSAVSFSINRKVVLCVSPPNRSTGRCGHPQHRAWRMSALVCCTLLGMAGCALQTYEPRPLDPALAQATQLARRPDDAALREAMSRLGIDTTVWPLAAWDAPELSALALASNPELAVARAEVAVAQAAGRSARQRANPSLELTLEHHSAPGASDSPWSVGVALDTLLGDWLLGQSRRQALSDVADAQQLEAVERAAQTAWQVHRRVRDSHRALFDAERLAAIANETLVLQREESVLWQRRLTLGAVSMSEVFPSQQRLAMVTQQAHQARHAVEQARSALAQAIGLPLEQTRQLPLRFASLTRDGSVPPLSARAPQAATPITSTEPVLEPLDMQRAALLNNIAVRIALARYASADAAVRVEIARQIPELSLKPGYAWDQGDHRWSLGLGFALPLSKRNAAPIAEALARREAEAVRFGALQAQAIAELDTARLAAEAAATQQADAQRQADLALALAERTARRVEHGDTDRLERLTGRRAEIDVRRTLVEAQAARERALAALEDVVQQPLSGAAALRFEPAPPSSTSTAP
ncbi:MAG: TolC family protein [Pseudomonadota bacterium]|nr:TolC family protein [Pseudomonadota bacterium]